MRLTLRVRLRRVLALPAPFERLNEGSARPARALRLASETALRSARCVASTASAHDARSSPWLRGFATTESSCRSATARRSVALRALAVKEKARRSGPSPCCSVSGRHTTSEAPAALQVPRRRTRATLVLAAAPALARIAASARPRAPDRVAGLLGRATAGMAAAGDPVCACRRSCCSPDVDEARGARRCLVRDVLGTVATAGELCALAAPPLAAF